MCETPASSSTESEDMFVEKKKVFVCEKAKEVHRGQIDTWLLPCRAAQLNEF